MLWEQTNHYHPSVQIQLRFDKLCVFIVQGLSNEKVEMGRNCKIVTEVVQNGNDFTWTQHFPGGRSTTNSFTVGTEADMETFGGKKFKVNSGSSSAPQPRVHLDLGWEANLGKVSLHGRGWDRRGSKAISNPGFPGSIIPDSCCQDHFQRG